jgi:hypothetical protein
MREGLALTAVATATLMPFRHRAVALTRRLPSVKSARLRSLMFGRDWAICLRFKFTGKGGVGARHKDHRRRLSTILD